METHLENFAIRLKRCIEYRHAQNPATGSFRVALNNPKDHYHEKALLELVNNTSAAVCLADLAGVSLDYVLRIWVESMEKRHPEISQMNAIAQATTPAPTNDDHGNKQ